MDSDTQSTAKKTMKDTVHGAVPQKHRLKLGMADGVSDPNGVGNPSKTSTVKNSPGGW